MAAANTKSKNNSVQPGRRTWRSCAGQTFGAANTFRTFAEIPVAASLLAAPELRESGCEAHREYRIAVDESPPTRRRLQLYSAIAAALAAPALAMSSSDRKSTRLNSSH